MHFFRIAVIAGAIGGLLSATPPLHAQAKKKRVPAATIVKDETAVADDQIDLDHAKNAYTQGITKKRQDFEQSDALKEAQKKVADCTKVNNDARAAAMAKVTADPSYQELQKADAAAQKKVDALKRSGASPDQINLASQDVLKIGAQESAMERKVTASDDALIQSSQKLVEANQALNKLKDDFTASLKTDKDLLALKKKQEDAETKLAKAKAKLDADNKTE